MKQVAPLLLLAACGGSGSEPVPVPVPVPVPDRTDELTETVLPLATDNGLSDLAVAPDGALWTVAERTRTAFRIELSGASVAKLDRVAITGIPDGVDIEGIDVLDVDTLLLGTEAHDAGDAGIWRATRAADGSFAATALLALSADANHGVEGVCGLDGGDAVVGAIETVETDADGARYAPVVVQTFTTPGARPAPIRYRVRLTSPTGKLSAIDCLRAADGTIEAIAIERHFDVARIVSFRLGADTTTYATLVVDLASLARGRNFEGLARLPTGPYALIVDNQWKTIEGDNELVLVTPPARPPAPLPSP